MTNLNTLAATNQRHVLVVDDEVNILKSLQRVLRKSAFTIHTAQSAEQAMTVLETHPIKVMLTDHKMPKTTGAQLIETVKATYPNIVCVMLSGQADYEKVVELMNSGSAYKFIKKPWKNDDLVEALDNAFGHFHSAYNTSWQQRVDQQKQLKKDFVLDVSSAMQNGEGFCLAAMQFLNIGILASSIGQQACENLQSSLAHSALELLPELTSWYCLEPGLFVFLCHKGNETTRDSFTEMLAVLNDKSKAISQEVHIDLRVAFKMSTPADTDPQLLVEQLKAGLIKTNAIHPVVQLNNELQLQLVREMQIKNTISSQLDAGQFSLLMQPKVNLSSQIIDSAECLIRWNHTSLGWVPPNEFIRLAELDGQINKIGNWVMEQGIQMISRLTRSCPDIKSISINVSARQLYQPNFISHLEGLLHKNQLDPSMLEIEITETCIADDIEYIQSMLWKIKLLGVKISIDDFGSGGTAYSYLANLPIDVLKLDKCLVDDIVFNRNKRTLVKSLIDICHSLSIEVVAEGVEDTETLSLLKSFSCDRVQGYIFSRAITYRSFQELAVMQPFISEVY